MPITINGSGTVTGITAGGLPDGVITTDDIAASAITRAKMGYAGAILQVVSMTTNTQTSATSSSFIDTAITLSITPTSSASKVLVMVVAAGLAKRDQDTSGCLNLLKGSTVLATIDGQFGYTGNTGHMGGGCAALNYLDSPATTSSITYKVQVRNNSATGQIRVNWDNNSTSSLVLMEVAA